MANSPEIKCEMMDPIEAGTIGALVKAVLRGRQYEDLVSALDKIPPAVLKLKNVPTVSAVALIGLTPSDVTGISHAENAAGDTVIKFKTPDDKSDTHHSLTIPAHPVGEYFFGDGWGSLKVGIRQVSTNNPADFAPLLATMIRPLRDAQRLNNFFRCGDGIVVDFSAAAQKSLTGIGYPDTPFAIVQQATPVRGR